MFVEVSISLFPGLRYGELQKDTKTVSQIQGKLKKQQQHLTPLPQDKKTKQIKDGDATT